MQRLTKDNVCYQMSSQKKPALRVNQGEAFCLELEDCYSGNLKTPDDVFAADMWDTVNPATGPVFVNGAAPGDVLRVDVLRIRTRDYAVMCVEEGAGALGQFIEGIETAVLPIRNNALILKEGCAVPLNPMIGVIGTAPRGEPVLNGTPGEHGGNMDCKEITEGAAVFLPVNVEGALFAAGDLHAAMGDGEVCICGAEVSGEVTLKATALRSDLPTPCVETVHHFHFIGSALSLDDCEQLVLTKAHTYLVAMRGLGPNEAARFMSLVGELHVCQVVDPLKTMRFSLPKQVGERVTPRI